jgi:hypothetical protein
MQVLLMCSLSLCSLTLLVIWAAALSLPRASIERGFKGKRRVSIPRAAISV